MMIFLVCFEMIGETVDSFGNQSNLDFGGAGIGSMRPVGLDCAGFGSFRYQLRSLLKNLDLEDPAVEDLLQR
jgi:hypothetical protein